MYILREYIQIIISKNVIFPSLKIDFVLANSARPGKMPQLAAFHRFSLHVCQSTRFGVSGFQRVKDCLRYQPPKRTFCGFSMGRNRYWAGRAYDLCVYFMTGTPERSTESGFMEKPGIGTNPLAYELSIRKLFPKHYKGAQYYTIIDFNEVDIRIYLPEKVIIHRGR